MSFQPFVPRAASFQPQPPADPYAASNNTDLRVTSSPSQRIPLYKPVRPFVPASQSNPASSSFRYYAPGTNATPPIQDPNPSSSQPLATSATSNPPINSNPSPNSTINLGQISAGSKPFVLQSALGTPTQPTVDNLTTKVGGLLIKEFKPSGFQPLPVDPLMTAYPQDPAYEEYYESDRPDLAQASPEPRIPLNYHLYNSPLPHLANLPANVKTSHQLFISDELRENLLRKNEAIVSPLGVTDSPAIPMEVHVFHSISKLEERDKMSTVFKQPTSIYKGISSVDGLPYVLRRIEGFRAVQANVAAVIEPFRKIFHSNIVTLRDSFTTKQFGDNSLVFVYDYHPLSQTMMEKQFSQGNSPAFPEKVIWSFISQISSALHCLHSSGLACRVIDLTKILHVSKNRLRINCLGMMEILGFDNTKDVLTFQHEDLWAFGHFVVALACNSLNAIQNLPKAIDYISRHFSPELKNVVIFLLSKPIGIKSIDDIIPLMGSKIFVEIDSTQHVQDYLEGELSKELENGRLVRLLCKLGFINERPEFDLDPSWSETGDRYLLKLFRDYVFHQVDENGDPILNLAHVLSCLNKLDAGHPEKIMLMSRDELSCIIVSYKDLKRCIEETFAELMRRKR